MQKKYRYELKFTLSKADADLLKRQLFFVCKLDSHSVSKEYSYDIRSLYFDNAVGDAYQDKVSGEMIRKKYRIRIYNGSKDIIKLECKHKDYNMTFKEEQDIDYETCMHLINKEYGMVKAEGGLLLRFITEAKTFGLIPAVIVDYRRLAFTYPVSEVRITFDEQIRSGRYSSDLFSNDHPTFSVMPDDYIEIEVKCNEFLPEHIEAVLNSVPKCRTAISKYALSYAVK